MADATNRFKLRNRGSCLIATEDGGSKTTPRFALCQPENCDLWPCPSIGTSHYESPAVIAASSATASSGVLLPRELSGLIVPLSSLHTPAITWASGHDHHPFVKTTVYSSCWPMCQHTTR